MHEMSLMESVLQIIEDAANQQGFTKVRRVWLEIGQLSCVEPEALRFSFDAVMRDSIAHHAQLEIVEVAGQGCCEQCGSKVAIAGRDEACPNCGSYAIAVMEGDQMRVKELEVE